MGLFKPRPKARIKIGNIFRGNKVNAVAQGYVIYKEWDATDKKNYYWEEWELTGFNDYDTWIEYDHYTRKVTMYEPYSVGPGVNLDPAVLQAHQTIETVVDGKSVTLNIKEIGTGTVARREGTLTHHVFESESLQYAEISYRGGVMSVEKYNNKEFDVYKGKVLSKKLQKELLGRQVQPLWIKDNWATLLTSLFIGGFLIAPYAIPSYETYCTPRTATRPASSNTLSVVGSPTQPSPTSTIHANTSKDPIVSQDSTQTCYRRTIYGGGSGGAGK